MSEASEIITAMHLSDKKIAEVIGFTKLAVMQVRLERSQGTRMLPKLRQLYAMRYGAMPQFSHTPKPLTPQVPDTPPMTYEQLEQELIRDEALQFPDEVQPIVESTTSLVRQASKAIITQRRTPASPERRVIESTPHQRTVTPSHQSLPSLPLWLQVAGMFIAPHQPLTHMPQERGVLPVIPKYVVTQQWAKTRGDTSQALRLSVPQVIHASGLGYSSHPDTSEQVNYGTLLEVLEKQKRK